MEDELKQDDDLLYRLPFNRASASERRLKGTGLCIQGNHGTSTHTGTLDYAVDFRLPVGTPVVASRAGRVAAITSHFVRGGVDAKFRPRANFVAVQHSDGTYARYFHLRHNGASVKKDSVVAAGDVLGLSGNTGFSSTPHLHFDVVDVLPEDTCCLGVGGEDVPAVAAAFSARLPRQPMRAQLMLAEPSDAHTPLSNSAMVKGNAVLIDRGNCSFTTKVKNAVLAQVSCIIVANSVEGPELFSMGGLDTPLDNIPAILVSKESGQLIREHLEGNGGKIEVVLSSSDGYELAVEKKEKSDNALNYVANTQEVFFSSFASEKPFIPQEGVLYPTGLARADDVKTSSRKKACCVMQ